MVPIEGRLLEVITEIASANKIAGGTLYDLSVQQLIDCAEDFGA